MLTITEDTTEEIHEMLIVARDKQRHEELGGGS